MRNIEVTEPTDFTYWTPNGGKTITLGDGDIFGVLTDRDGEVVDFFDRDTPLETVVNFATDAALFYHVPAGDGIFGTMVAAALRERALYADCFSVEITE